MPFQVYLSPFDAAPPPARSPIVAASSSGVPDLEKQLSMPPPTPGTEPPPTTDPERVAAHCDAFQQGFAKLGWKVVRKVITRNAQYGVVWRADVTLPIGGEPLRLICWKGAGRAGYSIMSRPLQMLDPSESIPPLGR